jgi:hypothetical protein
MIWLRHELWEYTDGLGYRLASRNDTDDSGSPLRGGTLKQIFYAPSPAAAKAQYWALRQLGPIIPSRFESDAPFTLAQLQAQLAQYPDDATLHGQPALHPGEEAPTAEVASEADRAPGHGALESLEPWPVVAHSEPAVTEETAAAEAEPALAEAEPEAAVEAADPPSNVVPIRIAQANAAVRLADASNVEPVSRELAVMHSGERQVAAPGALGLALAELGPAAAASGALALALAELEPTPNSMPDDGHPARGHAPLSLVASHSHSTTEEPPVSETLVAEPTTADETVAEETGAEASGVVLEAAGTEAVIAEPVVVEALAAEAAEPLVPEPLVAQAEVAEPLVPEPLAAEKAVEADPLGPITAVGTATTARTRGKRRKSGFFTGLLRIVMLLIILGVVIVGVGIATGTWDGPTLLAQAKTLPEQARALPDQIRNLSIVKTLLPG